MNKKADFVLILLIALVWALPALCAAPLPGWPRKKTDPRLSLDEILERMNQAGKRLKTLSANLEYTSVTVIVNDHSTESGKIYFRNGRSPELKIDFTRPAEQVLFKKNKGALYQAGVNQIQEFDLSRHANLVQQFLLLGFGSNADELKKNYSIKFLKEESLDGDETALLELTPLDPAVAQQLSKVELWINEESWVPVQQRFIERGSGDYKIARYTDIKVNRPLSSSLFRINAKEGARIIKMQ